MQDLKSKIREVPDWPKKGVTFYDLTTLLGDAGAFKKAVNCLVGWLGDKQVDRIVGIDARGFLVAAPVAYKIGAGLALVRKPGKLPYKIVQKKYSLEYGTDVLQMHKDAVLPGEKVILIDDLIATGGTAVAACHLVEKLGGQVVGAGFIVDLPFLGGSAKLRKRGYEVLNLVSYDSE